jgi:Ca-activated chloride channel homolog
MGCLTRDALIQYLLLMHLGSGFRRFVFTIWVLLLCPLFAASTDNLVLILDASGSMWGRVNEETKIEAARRVVRDLVGKLPEDAKLGLVAYGHRKKGECSDIETLVPPGSADVGTVPDVVDKLNPLGMTPITKSFEQAVEAASKVDDPGTIVLVTDGLETCDGDPCAAVRKAKAAGIDFVLHIVGFDVAKENVSSLECSAQAGGGLYFAAENAEELSAALEQTMTAQSPPAPEGPATLSVRSVVDGEPHDSMVEVFIAPDERVAAGRTYTGEHTNPRRFPLTAGTYSIVVTPMGMQGAAKLSMADVVVEAGKVVERVADFSTGELSVGATRNGTRSDATVRVRAAGTTKRIAGGRTYTSPSQNPAIYRLPPGAYDVETQQLEVKGAEKKLVKNVVVKAGERTEVSDAIEAGEISVLVQRNGELSDATISIRAAGANGSKIAGGRSYTSAKSNPAIYQIPPGNYDVIIGQLEVKGWDKDQIPNVVVKAGERTEVSTSVESGELKLGAVVGGTLVDATVHVADAAGTSTASGRTYTKPTSNPKTFTLRPGKYTVTVNPLKVEGATKRTLEVEVTAQKTTEQIFDFAQ